MSEPTPPSVSVVLPLYRNAATLFELLLRLRTALAAETVEVIGVDDCCPEESANILARAAAQIGIEARILRHSTNLGQNTTVLTGLRAARGRHVVVMDADLQDPPEEIPRLIAVARSQGVDVVFGRRVGRYRGVLDELTSYLFKSLLFRIARCGFDPRVGLFFVLSRDARASLVLPQDVQPYVMAMLAHARLSSCALSYARQPRRVGRSTYSFWHRLALAVRAFRCYWRLRRGRSA